MNIWVVIPACNEEKTIEKVVKGALNQVKNVLVVNDASDDKTLCKLKELNVLIVNNKKGLGYAKSLDRGLRKAFFRGADYCVTMDADGEHTSGALIRIINAINKYKPDIVVGKRSRKNRLMEWAFLAYSKIFFGFSDPLCGLRAYSSSIYKKYKKLEDRYTIGTQILFEVARDKKKIIEVPIKSEKRADSSRFAGSIRGNLLEARALINIILM